MIGRVVVAEVQVAAGVANERVVVVVVEHGHSRLQQSAGGGKRGHARGEAGGGAPDRLDGVGRGDVVAVNGVAANEHILIATAVQRILVLAADQDVASVAAIENVVAV